jgi:hypothetical protein
MLVTLRQYDDMPPLAIYSDDIINDLLVSLLGFG